MKKGAQDWSQIRYFLPAEFDSPDLPGSGQVIHMDLVRKIDIIRHELGIPLKINSAVRTVAHNAKVGGVDSSTHVAGEAVDIAANAGGTRFRLIEAALRHGITRIGIAKTFVHLDVSVSKPQGVIWLY